MQLIQCERCGEDFPRTPGRGRRPRFCSGRCRVAAHRASKLPEAMTKGRRWVRADGKRPMQLNGRLASTTSPATWATYNEVRHGPHGVMLGYGLGCYDLDHVTDEQARKFAATILEPVVFAERSMSGNGVHIFVEAPESAGWKRTIDGISVERYTKARFIRVTGDRIRL